jgi:hypothetical protein
MSSKLSKLGHARVSLIIVLAIVLTLIGIRFLYSSITGYLLPDEFWYYNFLIVDDQHPLLYREVFLFVYRLFFLGTADIQTLLLRGAVYVSIWGIGCVIVSYKIIRLLDLPDTTASLLILSLPLFPAFTLMLPMVVTETFGLFLALVGVFLTIRSFKTGGALEALLASLFFIMASKVREPYLLLAVGNLLIVLLSKKRSLKGFLSYAVPLAFFFPIPLSLGPAINFIQPYAYLVNLISSGPLHPSSSLQAITDAVTTVPQASPGQHVNVFEAFFLGLFYGYNPLFTVFLFISLGVIMFTLRNRRSSVESVVLLNMILALASYYVSAQVVVASLSAAALSIWASTIVRYSHTSLPAMFGFAYFYRRMKPRLLLGILLVFVVLASAEIPQFAQTIQSSQQLVGAPINRLSFDYRAPYFRLYLIAKGSGRTLVVGGLEMRGIRTYMSMLPNVVLVGVPPNETGLRSLMSQEWDSIYLYDDWYTITDPGFQYVYPAYYWALLHAQHYGNYTVHVLWVDDESYAMTLVKTTT